MTSVLTYLALQYPNFEQRAKVEELDLASKNLTGELDFTHLGFTNLKKLNLTNNQLTKLVLANPQQITYLDISNNQLNSLNTSELGQALTFGEIKNNSLPIETKKNWLIKRWNYYKDLEVDWPELLVPQITKLIDIRDLDDFVLNYDFNQEGNQEYHQIIGNGFTSLLDERALELLSQQVLARCLIKQNELVEGKNEEYEREINNLAHQFQRASNMFLKCPLKTIQKEVIRELAGDKDLVQEFQNQLDELTVILTDPNRNSGAGVPNLEKIKRKIKELQLIIQHQQEELIQLRQSYQEKKQVYNELWENSQKREEKLSFYADNLKTKEGIIEDYKKDVNRLEEKIQALTLAEENEKVCRQRIVELEEEIITKSNALNEFNELVSQKDTYIVQLEKTLKDLKKSKKGMEESLSSGQKTIDDLTRKQKKYKDWINRGIVLGVIVIFLGLGWYIYRKFKS